MVESSKYEEWLKTGKRMKSPWSPEVVGDQEMVGHDCPTHHEKVVTRVTRGFEPTQRGEWGSNLSIGGFEPGTLLR